jgi:hypothetical protein
VIAVTLAACALASGQYADRSCTPGAILTTSKADVCSAGWATAHRHVTPSQRIRVFRRYGIPYSQHRGYELDHLVPLEDGGSNSDRNLVPEPWPIARVKDRDENRSHNDVCSGRKTLRQVQRWIVRKWSR